jgi:hypothetical protein
MSFLHSTSRLACCVLLGASACIDSGAELAVDAPLAAQRAELLDLAFDAASAFPLQPHAKNRARAQEAVVNASFELGQHVRALEYARGIGNWRQGLALAEYAQREARRGTPAAALEPFLAEASLIADDPARTEGQDWRRDRIRVRIAEAWLLLGNQMRAAEYLQGAAPAEATRVDAAAASLADAASFDRQLAAVDSIISTGDLDSVRHVLTACVALYDRFYDDVQRRDRAESKVEESWIGLPVDINLDMRMALAEAALRHGDAQRGLAIVDRAHALFAEQSWTTVDRIRLRAQLAGLRHRCGDPERARSEAEAARLAFEVSRDEIVDIFRADALIPLAEAFHSLGDASAAEELFGLALTEAYRNPNSRPRCDDFVALCCSLALRGVDPTPNFWQRLREARARLGDPW